MCDHCGILRPTVRCGDASATDRADPRRDGVAYQKQSARLRDVTQRLAQVAAGVAQMA